MLTKYFADFHFCLHERKKHPFWESPFAFPVFGHLFLSKKVNRRTFGKSYFCVLYILLIFLLKETKDMFSIHTVFVY
jgi:hypothetical protein